MRTIIDELLKNATLSHFNHTDPIMVKKIVEKSLHKVKQRETLPDRNISAWLYCPNCNKPYHKEKRKSYNAHIKHCLKEDGIITTLLQGLNSELT